MVDPAGAQPWRDLCPQPQQDPAPCLRAGEWEAGEKPSHSEDSGAAQGSLASQLRPGHSTAPSHWLLGDLRAQVGHCPGEGQAHSAGLWHTSAPMTQRLSVQAVTLPAMRRPKAPPKEPATQKGPQGGAWSTGTSPGSTVHHRGPPAGSPRPWALGRFCCLDLSRALSRDCGGLSWATAAWEHRSPTSPVANSRQQRKQHMAGQVP